ncbi:hypothetical protein B0T13DRAFT_516283 [Neurospora crassa]|nr:hypothetical protein B0T13DRAFT_516283 [Neurospora crassa]
MPIVKDPQAFDGQANYVALGPVTLKTSFGGSTEPYPLALLEDTACDTAYPIRDSAIDSAHHDQTIHSTVHENTVRCCNDFDTPRADAHDSGWYRVITDDLIDPILLAWEEDHKIAFFPRPLAGFQHTTGHPDSDLLFKTSVNFMLNTIASAPITGHHAPTKCNFPNPATRPFTSNHNLTGNHSSDTFSPNVLNPSSGDSIQSTAHATLSNLQAAPAAGSSTLIKCRECNPNEAGWQQVERWAAQGIRTCTDCMRRPQRAEGKLCDHCFAGGRE